MEKILVNDKIKSDIDNIILKFKNKNNFYENYENLLSLYDIKFSLLIIVL